MLCERIYVADVEVKPSKNEVLASSAFVTLGVSVRSNKDQIFEAYDDRLFEGIPEHDLEVARSRLTLARDRLAQEIRFLTDVAPARAREMLVGLSGTAHSADALASDLPNLSRINAYAELLTRSGAEFLDHADQAHRDFDPAAAREAIDQTRAASGFSPITDAAWDRDIMTIMKGSAAVVMPDNVLFEGGAGETLRRKLLKDFNFHTLLRLPTGIFYSQGVKANVLFFDHAPAGERIATEALWVYDLRTNQRFTLRERPLKRADLDDFVKAYGKKHRQHERVENERFRRFSYDELAKRDKLNLDTFWLKDASATDPDSLPRPDEVAAEIVASLELALEKFRSVAAKLAPGA